MNKELSAPQVVEQLRDGMTIGIGGWGARRKPMALVREILRSDVKDLTVVSYGGPEIGMLCRESKIRKLIFGFVSMDVIPLEPYFRKARQAGKLEVMELDEGMLEWGLRAAAMRLPFLPTRCGLGTDVVARNPELKMVRSPYDDGETLVAMPALKLDISLIHVNEADRLGNTLIRSVDPYFDNLFARAADRCYVSCEALCDRLKLDSAEARFGLFERSVVTGVVHAPFGAHPTYCSPEYGWDIKHLKEYSASASRENGWEEYSERYLGCDEAAYLAKVTERGPASALPLPAF